MVRTRGEEVKDLDRVRKRCRIITRETSELAYIWDSERGGKTEFSGIVNNVK